MKIRSNWELPNRVDDTTESGEVRLDRVRMLVILGDEEKGADGCLEYLNGRMRGR